MGGSDKKLMERRFGEKDWEHKEENQYLLGNALAGIKIIQQMTRHSSSKIPCARM